MQKIKLNSLQLFFFALANFLCSSFASANTQNEFIIDDVKILVDESSNKNATISITTGSSALKVTGMFVENPARVVFDIMDFKPQNVKSFNINSPLFKKIRVGLHKDKTRIVFDCTSNDVNKLIDESSGKNYLYTVSGSSVDNASPKTSVESKKENSRETAKKPDAKADASLEDSSAKVEKTTTPTQELPKSPTLKPTLAVTSTQTPTNPPTQAPTVAPTVKLTPPPAESLKEVKPQTNLKETKTEPTATIPEDLGIEAASPEENETINDVQKKLLAKIDSGDNADKNVVAGAKSAPTSATKVESDSVIKSIVFQTTAEQMQSSMVISTSNPINYSINHTSKTSYELIIPGAKLKGDHLKLPQFPPDSFKGFLYFQASEVEGGVTVKIEVEDGVNLSPYLAMGKLWVKADLP